MNCGRLVFWKLLYRRLRKWRGKCCQKAPIINAIGSLSSPSPSICQPSITNWTNDAIWFEWNGWFFFSNGTFWLLALHELASNDASRFSLSLRACVFSSSYRKYEKNQKNILVRRTRLIEYSFFSHYFRVQWSSVYEPKSMHSNIIRFDSDVNQQEWLKSVM